MTSKENSFGLLEAYNFTWKKKINLILVWSQLELMLYILKAAAAAEKPKKRKNSISAGLRKNYFCFFLLSM